jgi:hypothetical protein
MEEGLSHWRMRYRATVDDEPTPGLDDVILKAANRRAMYVRTVRRGVVALVLALAAAPIWPLWHLQLVHAPRAKAASDYGRQEGSTRYYLLNVAATSYTGPGSTEQ